MSAFTFPEPLGPSLTAGPRLRWGIIGTGEIAGDFANALHAHTNQRVVAVTSRAASRGETFARTHGFEQVFDDAHHMASDPGVDVVYVATPHRQHHAGALAAITAGTPVLIEKPLGLTTAEAEDVALAARSHGVFAAEGMWTRYQPGFRVLGAILEAGDLGKIRLAHADVGWAVDLAAGGRMLDPAEGGGALLDMGVYSLWFAQFAIGHPVSLTAEGTMQGGVDMDSATVLRSRSGAIATATSTFRATTDGLANITGTTGTVRFLDHFVFPGRFAITRHGESTTWQEPNGLTGRSGLAHEAVSIATHIAEGRTTAPLHSLDDSIALARSMDAIRTQLTAKDQNHDH